MASSRIRWGTSSRARVLFPFRWETRSVRRPAASLVSANLKGEGIGLLKSFVDRLEPFLMEPFQEAVDAYIAQFDEGYWAPLAQLAALVEEIGEVARFIMALGGTKPLKSERDARAGLAEELGDVMVALSCIATPFGIDLADACLKSVAKYGIRDRDRWSPGED